MTVSDEIAHLVEEVVALRVVAEMSGVVVDDEIAESVALAAQRIASLRVVECEDESCEVVFVTRRSNRRYCSPRCKHRQETRNARAKGEA